MIRFSLLLSLLFCVPVLFAQEGDPVHVGREHTIKSSVLNEERTYLIYLPKSYNLSFAPNQHYPVMVLIDGGVYFHAASGAVEFLSTVGKIPEMIIVAIKNTDRTRDLSISHSTKGPHGEDFTKLFAETGGANTFMEFITTELLPVVDQNYRTMSYRLFVGHSLGGLVVTNSFTQNNPNFLSYIAIDPALWWDDNKVVHQLEEQKEIKPKAKSLYMTSAHNSHTAVDTSPFRRSQEYYLKVFESKLSADFRYKFEKYPNENHSSVFLISLHDGLRFVFDKYAIDQTEDAVANEIQDHFERVSANLGATFLPPETMLQSQAEQYLIRGEIEKSLEFYQLYLKCYPMSVTAHIKSAEAYLALKDKENARKYLKLALKLDPHHKYARHQLKELENKK